MLDGDEASDADWFTDDGDDEERGGKAGDTLANKLTLS